MTGSLSLRNHIPNSNNPEIIKNWLVEDKIDYQEMVDKWLEKKKEVD